MITSRRELLQSLGAGALGAVALSRCDAFPLGLAPGLQLWSIKEDLARDEDATLRKIAGIGYCELEHYEMPKSPADFRRQCERHGLKLVSSHFDMPMEQFGSQKTIDGARAMGLQYMVVVFPMMRSLSAAAAQRMSF